MSEREPACLYEGPNFIPSRDLGVHVGTLPPPPSRRFCRAYLWHPNEWFPLSFGATVTLVKLSSGEEASSLSGRKFIG